MLQVEEFCCPTCKGVLSFQESEYACSACSKKYPVILGIPDFRVFPDPYIDFEDDHKKAGHLAEQYHKLDFMGLVRLYWKMTPEVSEDRAERFIRRTAALVEKGARGCKTKIRPCSWRRYCVSLAGRGEEKAGRAQDECTFGLLLCRVSSISGHKI